MLVWARFGVVHREHEFAVLVVENGTNITNHRYWVLDGFMRDHTQGFAMQNIFHSYSGNPQDTTLYCFRAPVAFACTPDEMVREILNEGCDVVRLPQDWIKHREDGPAMITIARDAHERATQTETGTAWDECSGTGMPENVYYLNGDGPLAKDAWRTWVEGFRQNRLILEVAFAANAKA